MNEPDIEKAVRRTVGIAALRKLRDMADAEKQNDETQARWAFRLSWLFAIAALLTVAWLAFR